MNNSTGIFARQILKISFPSSTACDVLRNRDVLRNLDSVSNKLGFGDSLSFKMSIRVFTPWLKLAESVKDKSVISLFALWIRKKCERDVYGIMTLVISEHFYANELSILGYNLLNYSVLNTIRTNKYVGNKELFISFLHSSIKLCYYHDFNKLEI
jgi:hypothetical protein